MPMPRLVDPCNAPHCLRCGSENAREYTPPAESFAAQQGWYSPIWLCFHCAASLKLWAHHVTATVRLPLPTSR